MHRMTDPVRAACALLLMLVASTARTDGSPPTHQLLTLAEAERIAMERDPLAARHRDLADAAAQRAVAAGQLPDPLLSVAAMNFPVDSFRRDQEPMTQLKLGVTQMFPRGDTRSIQSDRERVAGAADAARAENQRRLALRGVREDWLELYYWTEASRLLEESRNVLDRLEAGMRGQYASGRAAQHDVTRLVLERSLLDDRLLDAAAAEQSVRARLEKWVGAEAAAASLPRAMPVLPAPPGREAFPALLAAHPAMRVEDALVEMAEKDVALAREAYAPGWSISMDYGIREDAPTGVARPDFVSVMVMVDLPIFTADRQDRRLADSRLRRSASVFSRADRLRDLHAMAGSALAGWLSLSERRRRYEDAVLEQAAVNLEAARAAYRNTRSDFSIVMRAAMTDIDTRLRALRIRVDLAKSQAVLLFFVGETS